MKVFTICTIIILIIAAPLFAGGQAEEPQEPENTMMMMQSEEMKDEPGPFIHYTGPEKAMMLAEEKPTILFFHASWCPSCREASEDFTNNSKELMGVNLILVDYDNSDELQKKYGITYQHTFVQIDKSGNALTKWNGGGTEELLENIVDKEN